MTDTEATTTLDELRAARVAAEDEYLARVREFEVRVARVLEAAAAAEGRARAAETPAAAGATPVEPPAVAATPTGRDPEGPAIRQPPGQAPWPAAARGIRGSLNRIAHWWLRDYLAVLDARHEALTASACDLGSDLDERTRELQNEYATLQNSAVRLEQGLHGVASDLETQRARQVARTEGLREGFNRVAEAMDLIAGTTLRLRTLMNAKDAEGVRRAVGAVDQKSETVLDILARRQEALLADLVGRRQELEALVAEVRAR